MLKQLHIENIFMYIKIRKLCQRKEPSSKNQIMDYKW